MINFWIKHWFGIPKASTYWDGYLWTWLLRERVNLVRNIQYKLWPETIKLLEENIGKTLSNINHSRILYDPPPRIFKIKAKTNKWDLMKLKSFCTTKETISKVKRQPSEWKKIIANEATDKGLISKIYNQLLQLNSRKDGCYPKVYKQ